MFSILLYVLWIVAQDDSPLTRAYLANLAALKVEARFEYGVVEAEQLAKPRHRLWQLAGAPLPIEVDRRMYGVHSTDGVFAATSNWGRSQKIVRRIGALTLEPRTGDVPPSEMLSNGVRELICSSDGMLRSVHADESPHIKTPFAMSTLQIVSGAWSRETRNKGYQIRESEHVLDGVRCHVLTAAMDGNEVRSRKDVFFDAQRRGCPRFARNLSSSRNGLVVKESLFLAYLKSVDGVEFPSHIVERIFDVPEKEWDSVRLDPAVEFAVSKCLTSNQLVVTDAKPLAGRVTPRIPPRAIGVGSSVVWLNNARQPVQRIDEVFSTAERLLTATPKPPNERAQGK